MVDENNTWKTTGDNDSDIESDTYDPYDLGNYVVAIEEIYNFFKYFYNRVVNISQN
jgi:hypothetical protein